LLIPVSVPVRFVITSADVIHSWALPRFFFKLDAIAGLLSVFNTEFNQLGVFYGQCREICGANHSFIPVVVEVTSFNGFFNWLLNL
jgi:heme/copper-type cytochrome/quinol oxidase subunit 2